jgi:hypothetical protein
MMTNGNGRTRSISEILADVERDIARERREEENARIAALEAALAEANAKLDKLTAPPPLRRSEMSPRAKSDYLNAHGWDAYWKLPW